MFYFGVFLLRGCCTYNAHLWTSDTASDFFNQSTGWRRKKFMVNVMNNWIERRVTRVSYLYISQTWIKTWPHLRSTAPIHVTVGVKQKSLKLDRAFVFLPRNIIFCINIIISQAPSLTFLMYLLRWSSIQYWMVNWESVIFRYLDWDILKYFCCIDKRSLQARSKFFSVEIFDSDIWWKTLKTFYLFIWTHKYCCWWNIRNPTFWIWLLKS